MGPCLDRALQRAASLAVVPVPLTDVTSTDTVAVMCVEVTAVVNCNVDSDTVVVVTDGTTSAPCTLHGDLVNRISRVVCPGVALLLKNVSSLVTDEGRCLVVCAHNVVSVFDDFTDGGPAG